MEAPTVLSLNTVYMYQIIMLYALYLLTLLQVTWKTQIKRWEKLGKGKW